jgi:imidazoleglycerol-phosphate dehydratase/histidinol-phosphatase
VQAGYRLVVVSNQDGLGSGAWPRENFDTTQKFIERLFSSQGIEFHAVFFCPHVAADDCACRKPRAGLVLPMLASAPMDMAHSFVVGDRVADLGLAETLGIPGFRISPGNGGVTWDDIVHTVLERPRVASHTRTTRETDVTVDVDLDRAADAAIETGIGFFDHMLEQIAKHAGIALRLSCSGDLEVDEHHTVEDCALTLGSALREALGDKRGIGRYGFVVPMDEALAQVSLDLSGRSHFTFEGEFGRETVGGLATELVPHFFRSLADSLGAALHISVTGENAHHMIEACFKATGRALGQAIARDGSELPSTKGVL